MRVFLKPAPDKKVPKPVGGHLAATGEWQNADSYWRRRINDGDVVQIDGPSNAPAPTPAPTSAPTPSVAPVVVADTARHSKKQVN